MGHDNFLGIFFAELLDAAAFRNTDCDNLIAFTKVRFAVKP
jgi:hypothetical protein